MKLGDEEKLGIVFDEIGGGKVAAEQMDKFFLHREERYREKSLERCKIILAKQLAKRRAIRYRWRIRTHKKMGEQKVSSSLFILRTFSLLEFTF